MVNKVTDRINGRDEGIFESLADALRHHHRLPSSHRLAVHNQLADSGYAFLIVLPDVFSFTAIRPVEPKAVKKGSRHKQCLRSEAQQLRFRCLPLQKREEEFDS